MLIIRWTIFGFIVLYFLLAFIFIHQTVSYTQKIKQSEKRIDALFSTQLSLLQLLFDDLNNVKPYQISLNIDLTNADKATTNRLLAETEREMRAFIAENNLNLTQGPNYLSALADNTVSIRNEIYLRNKLVDNFNINCDSVVFVVFVVIMRLKKLDKY